MKAVLCFILTLLVGALALTPEQQARLDKISKECRELNSVSEETIAKVRKGETIDDPKVKKHILCVSKKTGLANEAGETIVEVLRTKLRKVSENDDQVENIIRKCVIKHETPEDTAYYIYNCLRKSKPKFSPVL